MGEPQVPTTFERSGRPARRRLTSTGSQSHQTKKHPSGCFLFGGRRWIRTIEVSDNRFTVCPLWPLGNSPIYKPNRSWIVLWSWWTASNPRPADYKSAALPAELHQLGFDKCYFIITIYQCQAFFEFFYSADFPSSTLRSRLGFYILYGVNEPAFRLPVPALPDCRTGSHSSGSPLPR